MPDELTPTTNIEKFLAKTAGESVELPEPATRIEKYLNKIASEQTITEATDNWLDEHIDPSTGYVLDSTLTMNNAAPPASAVGDLKSAISPIISQFDKTVNNNDVTITGRTSYFYLANGDALIKNQKYHITLTFDTLPSISAIYTHTSSSSGSVVDTITSSFVTTGAKMECDYTPTVDNVKYIRIVLTASPSSGTTYPINVKVVAININSLDKINEATAQNTAEIENTIKLTYQKPHMKFGAHQGERLSAPANSIPAYELAGQHGWDYLWLAKCRMSVDGTWYVMHDDDVSTTTDGTGNLSEMIDAEIAELHINQGVNVDKYSPSELKVPTLEEGIQIALKYGMGICFRFDALPSTYESADDKAAWDSFLDLIYSYDMRGQIFSGTGDKIALLRTIVGEDWEGCLWISGTATAEDILDEFETADLTNNLSCLINFEVLDASQVKELHRNKIKCYTYSSAPTNAQLLSAITWGCDIYQNGYAYKYPMPT